MKHIKKFNENLSSDDIQELKVSLSELPEMRWNIIEDNGYFGDEWDNWEHGRR